MKTHLKHLARRLLAPGLVLALGWPGPAAGSGSLPEPVVGGFYERWFAAASGWLTGAERRAFLALDEDLERELFIRRFWQARVDASGDPQLPARWQLGFEEALHRFEDLGDERARALLAAGKPARVVVFAGCRNVIRPLRIWSYGLGRGDPERPGAGPQRLYLVFALEGGGGGDYRHWSPDAGTVPLLAGDPARGRQWPAQELIDYALAKGCFRWSRHEAGVFAAALRGATGPAELRRRTVPPSPDPGWLARLAAELEDGAGAVLPGASVAIDFPGRYQRKTVVRGRVTLPAAAVQRNAEGLLFDRIVIAGDVLLGDRLVDAFRVVHLVAGAAPAVSPPRVALDFYRRLRPGAYSLRLRVEDAGGRGLLREDRRLEVPAVEQEASAPAGRRLGLPGLTRSQVGVLTTFPGVEILEPAERLLVGEVEIEAVTTGGPIERLQFHLDGALAGSDGSPPYAATLELGAEPRPRLVTAVALDPEGREIARDAATLNAGPGRFAVRLVAPLPGSGGRRAEVEVDVPADRRLDRLELFVGSRRIAVLTEPPFEHPLPAPVPGAVTYVRVLATLDDGEALEDLVFVRSPDPFERIDVQLVELYTSVRDRRGRFVTGLTEADFRVLEDGAAQPIRHFDTVENLAINVALLMDVSSSMRGKIGIATRSAQRFFETVLTPKDRASLMTVGDDIRQVVPFTGDVDALRFGVSGFRAWGTTRLFDGVIYALQSFGGLEGKRALVLLSDGQDVDSDFYAKQVLEVIVRSGVAVYPIALGALDPQTLAETSPRRGANVDLESFAEVSGGRCFQIAGAGELDSIYRQIEEELRSQYLLVYEPPPSGRRELRLLEVEVLREGLRARSSHGYYP